jgi:hypothetical protein
VKHPKLARPISAGQFCMEFMALWSRARPDTGARIIFDERLSRVHRRNVRRYAETDVRQRRFYFAPEVLWLQRRNRLGLIAHEIGHVIMGGRGTEAQADCAAFDDLDVVIEYDRRWGGRGLQSGRFAR